MRKKWSQKQYYKLTLVVLSIIYLLVVFGFAILSYNTVSSDAKKALGNKAMVLAVDIAEHLDLDGQEYERLLSLDFDQLLKDPVNIEFEQKARAVMKYADIKYIYLEAPVLDRPAKYQVEEGEEGIYGMPPGTPLNVVFLLDAVIDEKNRWDDTDGHWYKDKSRYTVFDRKFQEAYESRHPTSYINHDEWGTYITGYAPYYDNDDVYRGLIGVDLFLDAYMIYLRNNVLMIVGFVLTLIAIGIFALCLSIRMKKVQDLAQEKSILSDIDGLTNVFNRRHFLELMQQKWEQGEREHKPLALLIIDVDSFKDYNDSYGHMAGDKVLCMIAKVLKSNVRQDNDLVGRYGGDEFVVLLHNCDLSTAKNIAENLMEKIQDLQVEHQCSSDCPYQTVTIGLAAMIPAPDTNIGVLFSRADNALYYGKEQGKNRVQAWDESIPDRAP